MTWNSLKTFILLATLTLLLVVVGKLVGGATGMTIALILAAFLNLGAYFFGHKLILWQYRAQPLSEREYGWLHEMTRRLAQRAGLPMPKLYLIPEMQPNAFATGPSPAQGIVAFTAGLLQTMTPQEVEGVLAHELAHIKNRDMLTMTIAATIVGAITWLVDMLRWSVFFRSAREREEDNGLGLIVAIAVGIVASIAATLIQLAISRAREYEADRTAAELVGSPDGLISALNKLDSYTRAVPMEQATTATAHLFIANPLAGAGDFLLELFSTHPPIPKRIARLSQLRQRRASYRLA